ncbi:phage holin family protein [Paenibacillus ginsengarvi]|uniref:Holin n=1 Tax=Paenibacillus ginsengarvi TaxID=400777 RepID=A0A3B0BP08_9BACL|nr:phage holin family protein [Paenibacillus ginsengarvi]RKN75085.1 holin [Paenibacillus ginsengarvi]
MEQTGKVVSAVAGGILLPVFEFLYGAGIPVLYTMAALSFFIVMDWMSGSSAAKKDKTYASKYGIDGIFRTFFMVMLPAGGHMLDMVTGLPGIFFGIFAFGLLYHTLKSMTANAVRAGWAQWLPIALLEKVIEWVGSEMEAKVNRALQRKAERGAGNDGKGI